MNKWPVLLLLVVLSTACKKHKVTRGNDNLPQGWSQLGGSMGLSYSNAAVFSIVADRFDNIIICPDYDPAGHWAPLKFDGNSWSKLGTLNSSDFLEHWHLKTDQANNVYVTLREATEITNSTNLPFMAKYDGSTWKMLGPDNNSNVSAVSSDITFAVTPSGTVYAAFLLPVTGGTGTYTNRKWNGSAWANIPDVYTDAVSGLSVDVTLNGVIAADAANNIYAGGIQGGNKVVSKYNGTSWQSIGFPFVGSGASIISELTCDKDNNLYLAAYNATTGKYGVYKWNGTNWFTLGGLSTTELISTLAAGASGRLYAAGNFTNTAGKRYVAEWNGSAWSELGGANAFTTNDNIYALAVDSRGYVYVGGDFVNTSGDAYIAVYKP